MNPPEQATATPGLIGLASDPQANRAKRLECAVSPRFDECQLQQRRNTPHSKRFAQSPRMSFFGLVAIIACSLFTFVSPLSAQDTDDPKTNAAATADAPANKAASDDTVAESAETNADDTVAVRSRGFRARIRHHGDGQPLVRVGQDVELKKGETARAVVVIGASAKISGKVEEAVVVVGGNLDIEGGEIGDAAVVVLGDVRAGEGSVINGDVVIVGGDADLAKGAKIGGEIINTGKLGLPSLHWLNEWLKQCVLKLRPLAPGLGWVWTIWGIFLLVYVLIAAAFPRPVRACVDELSRRPATTFLMGLLSKLLLPVVLIILVATGIGIIVVPFLLAALVLAFLVGKVAIMEALGFQIGRQFSGDSFQKPLAAFLLGAFIITLLYLIPILGLITFGITSVWGLGAAVTAAFGGFRKELPQKPTTPPETAQPQPTEPAPVPAPAAAGVATYAASATEPAPAMSTATPPPESPPSPPASAPAAPSALSAAGPGAAAVAALPDAWAFPKASFWERMAAAFLDLVLVGILVAVVHGMPQGLLVALAYFSGMWTWKSTTIGGIVIGLKIARADGQPLTFTIALIRGLAAAFSVVVFFLGFLWIIWDKDKQGWHDRIAGTVVVKLPKGTPLVCL